MDFDLRELRRVHVDKTVRGREHFSRIDKRATTETVISEFNFSKFIKNKKIIKKYPSHKEAYHGHSRWSMFCNLPSDSARGI